MEIQKLIEEIARVLVDNPDDVVVSQIDGEQTIVYELRVNETDLGKIIGKNGNMIQSIRTLLKAASAKMGRRLMLEVIE